MIIVPTRGRPENLKRLLMGCYVMGTGSRIVARVDDDDPAREDYVKALCGLDSMVRATCTVISGPRYAYGPKCNDVFREHPDEPFYALVDDDCMPRTIGWDWILAKAAGPWGIAYGDDVMGHPDLGNQPFIGGEFARAVGWLCHPGLTHLFTDNVLQELGRRIDHYRFVPQVIVEHLHFSVGKSSYDETYRKLDGQGMYCHTGDKAVFDQALSSGELDRIAQRILGAKKERENGNGDSVRQVGDEVRAGVRKPAGKRASAKPHKA